MSGNSVMIASGLGDLVTGLGAAAFVFGFIVLIVLAIFMPWFVYKIASRARTLVEQAEDLKAQAQATKAEQTKTNALLRQLLIASGQDPQA